MTDRGLETLLTPADVAERFQISTKTVLRAIRSYRMRADDVEAWLDASEVQAVVVPLRPREPVPGPPVAVDGRLRVPRSRSR